MSNINININLKAIPADLIKRVGEAAYINLNIRPLRDGADERGNDHSVSVFVPQDRRDAYPKPVYIGRGREYKDEPHVGGTPFKKDEPKPAQPVNEETDLPF